MAETTTGCFVSDLLYEPHIRGRRISVRTIHDRVEGRGLEPQTVADRFDLDLADVYRALAYYPDHRDEMECLATDSEASQAETRAEAEAHRPPGVDQSSE